MILPYIVSRELKRTFRSLSHRNFRLYFFGQLVSLSGTWMQGLAVSWLVYKLTKSAWMLGLVSFASLLPILLFGLVGGWVADRLDRKKVLLCAQVLAMVQATTLAILTISGQLQIWHIICLTAFLGTINAFEMPARQAFIVNMVEGKDLVNAISLNAWLFHASRTLGPAVAGVLVSCIGEGPCFVVNALSYLGIIVALIFIHVQQTVDCLPRDGKLMTVSDALRFAFLTPHIRKVLILATFTSFFGMQYLMLLPIFASEVLKGEAGALAALTVAAGIGASLAALILASRATSNWLRRGIGYASLCFSAALIAFSLSQNIYLSVLLMVFVGFFVTAQLSGSHSLIQLSVSDQLRGKLMSIWMINILGMMPLGSLAVGWFAHHWGAPLTLMVCALFCGLSGFIYLARR